jgi:hypothetical protein
LYTQTSSPVKPGALNCHHFLASGISGYRSDIVENLRGAVLPRKIQLIKILHWLRAGNV